ncbi:MAG: DciA family protein [Proteobacteria bacterium]|nr:DciA family protein [Pseudomonadota bacterium]
MDTLDKHFRNLASAAFKAHGFATADLLSHWPAIVGDALASLGAPERIKWPRPSKDAESAAGTLFLKALPGRSLDLQYASETLLERINQFMGYRAIARIKVSAGTVVATPAPAKTATAAAPPATPGLDQVADPELREALNRLASGVFTEPRPPRSPQEEQGPWHQSSTLSRTKP